MSAKFIVEDEDYVRIPGLEAFLEKIEKSVSDFAVESGADEDEIRRFVVGRVGYKDMNQVLKEFKFDNTPSRGRAISSWNAFIAQCSEEDENFSFSAEYMASLKERYKSIDDEQKKKLEWKKEVLEHMKEIGNKRPNNPERVELFNECYVRLKENVNAMYTNFQHHIIVYGINGITSHRDQFHTFTLANSPASGTANVALRRMAGCKITALMSDHINVKTKENQSDVSTDSLNSLTRAELLPIFRKEALRKWAIIDSKAANVPWSSIWDDNNKCGRVVNWPKDDAYKFTAKGISTQIMNLKKNELISLIRMFVIKDQNEIKFAKYE